MLFGYTDKSNVTHLACTQCVETGLAADFNPSECTLVASHPKQGQLIKCDYCGENHILVVPQKPRVQDRKEILSLSIPGSLKRRIEKKVKLAESTITAILYPIVVPILEKEFPDEQASTEG